MLAVAQILSPAPFAGRAIGTGFVDTVCATGLVAQILVQSPLARGLRGAAVTSEVEVVAQMLA